MQATRILLDQSEIPTHWYKAVADMPNLPALPLGLHGLHGQPGAPAMIFCRNEGVLPTGAHMQNATVPQAACCHAPVAASLKHLPRV